MKKKIDLDDWLNPLYIPLLTAIPIDVWLLVKQPPYQDMELTLYIVSILFLILSGSVETSQEEGKHRLLGSLYLLSAFLFGAIGLMLWYDII